MVTLATLGRDVPDSEIIERRKALTPDTAATLCYTSGTTGKPKGCVLTHGNLHAEAASTVELLHPVFQAVTGQTAATLLFLPLAHILGRTIQIACLIARIELGHCPSIKPEELRPELRSFRHPETPAPPPARSEGPAAADGTAHPPEGVSTSPRS